MRTVVAVLAVGAVSLMLLALSGPRSSLFSPALARTSSPVPVPPTPPAAAGLVAPARAPAPAPAPADPAPALQETPPVPAPPAKVWPSPLAITGVFGERRSNHVHEGLDFGGAWGDPIVAAADGTVVHAGWAPPGYSGYGMVVIVDSGDGSQELYAHVSSVHVAAGQPVHACDLVASMGATGRSTGAHLHFEVRVNGTPIDPLGWLPAR